ncbi:integrase core domain-containing protein [Streptomyces sp. NPDC050263]|uniref:integrase core domain-containing protein n=1 Tax=Streptomyces sp. NPDC050263 TaxID=3155037 RepID=UPI003433A779
MFRGAVDTGLGRSRQGRILTEFRTDPECTRGVSAVGDRRRDRDTLPPDLRSEPDGALRDRAGHRGCTHPRRSSSRAAAGAWRSRWGASGRPWTTPPRSRSTRSSRFEYIHRHTFATRAEARLKTATWIADFYNTKRRHSAAGGKPPVEFERIIQEARARTDQEGRAA